MACYFWAYFGWLGVLVLYVKVNSLEFYFAIVYSWWLGDSVRKKRLRLRQKLNIILPDNNATLYEYLIENMH